MKKPRISVIGLGFVGLTLAVINAKQGFETVGIDVDLNKIKILEKGVPDFYEPKLKDFLKESLKKEKISFTKNFDAIKNTDIIFVTVGTPTGKNGKINLSFVKKAINSIIKTVRNSSKNHLIVIKSTVIPTTTQNIIFPKFEKIKNIKVVVNPEFLRESRAIDDLLKPHLIVIGENKTKDGFVLENYYKIFYKKLPEILYTDFTTAEMIKYSNNAFLATKISFINSIANICQEIPNADIKTIAYAIGKDSRIGSLFLNAGPGFGGSCLPKDLSALIKFSKKAGGVNSLLESVKKINQIQPKKIIHIMDEMNVLRKGNVVSVLGLSFKKDTNDIREAVSIPFVEELLKKGLKVKVHDPMALDNFQSIFKNKIKYCKTIPESISESHCCIILTEWDEYKKLEPKILKKLMKKPNIVDARRILEPKKFEGLSFRAIGLGSKYPKL